MIEGNSPSNKRRKVSPMKYFSYECGIKSTNNHKSGLDSKVMSVTRETRQNIVVSEDSCSHHRAAYVVNRFKEDESVDLIMKKAGFNLGANSNNGSERLGLGKRKFTPSCGNKVKLLSVEESIRLIGSQRRRRKLSNSSSNIQWKPLLDIPKQNQRYSPKKPLQERKQRNSPENEKLSNEDAVRVRTHKQPQHRDERLSPREEVLKVLRLFEIVFKTLEQDKAVRHTTRVDYETRTILIRKGKQVNTKKMIGQVPGIKVGDKFQYKSELNLIGLHFDIMGGIDYMIKGDMKLATSIVSSEGNNGYSDRFDYDVMIYSGQGGNLTSKDQKLIEDQKLVTGNLALANCMKEESPVRVIRGVKRLDGRGKMYVYVGLYLVKDYWREKGPQGNVLFKFKLRRVSGQPYVDLRY